MSFETELVQFVNSRPSFYNPIVEALTVVLGSAPDPTDVSVKSRLCYGAGPNNVGNIPYLVWTGPTSYEPGNYSGGALTQKKARYWFTVYTEYLDDAINWINAIEQDMNTLFVPGYFFDLTTCRITQMIQEPFSKSSAMGDQTQRTGAEFPNTGATISYVIGWQNAS